MRGPYLPGRFAVDFAREDRRDLHCLVNQYVPFRDAEREGAGAVPLPLPNDDPYCLRCHVRHGWPRSLWPEKCRYYRPKTSRQGKGRAA